MAQPLLRRWPSPEHHGGERRRLIGYKLEPQLITALSEDKNRTKRRLVTYSQIPPKMVQAVLAIEDRRFFEHGGINYGRTMKCAVQDLISHRMNCGGSTLTQQLAKNFFLTPDKKLSRKIAEAMITFQLEARFNKQQIFEMYANEIPLGQRGSFAINGFGEAAEAYFGKDLRQLDLAQCALLAGIIQRPSYFAPYDTPNERWSDATLSSIRWSRPRDYARAGQSGKG
jgi:penicillin-binding protein 1B